MDLSTRYMGLRLKNPIVPSACQRLSGTVDGIRRLEDAGAGAIVLFSLFEEQIAWDEQQMDHYLSHGTETFAEALTYFPRVEQYQADPDEYLELVRMAKESINIPLIASLNGVSPGGWMDYARYMEAAGADAIELNVYFIPTDATLSGLEVEQLYLDILAAVRRQVSIPVAMKLSPFFSAPAAMGKRLADAGADGLVLFNRFYQPDIDLESLELNRELRLSEPNGMMLPLRWIAILRGQVECSLAATTGIHTAEDVLKVVMAGADVAMMCSALIRNGPGRIARVLQDMRAWMEAHEYTSVEQMKGSMSYEKVAEPAAYVRANYMQMIHGFR